mgnify:CR=1 FL=1
MYEVKNKKKQSQDNVKQYFTEGAVPKEILS